MALESTPGNGAHPHYATIMQRVFEGMHLGKCTIPHRVSQAVHANGKGEKPTRQIALVQSSSARTVTSMISVFTWNHNERVALFMQGLFGCERHIVARRPMCPSYTNVGDQDRGQALHVSRLIPLPFVLIK